MRYLGLDYGSRRIGVAISDENLKIAFPRGVIQNQGRLVAVKQVAGLVSKEKIAKIIVGLPRSLQARDTTQTRETREFAKDLQKTVSVPLEFEDEILTSRMAEGPPEKKDASAAAIILQTYLDRILKASNSKREI